LSGCSDGVIRGYIDILNSHTGCIITYCLQHTKNKLKWRRNQIDTNYLQQIINYMGV